MINNGNKGAENCLGDMKTHRVMFSMFFTVCIGCFSSPSTMNQILTDIQWDFTLGISISRFVKVSFYVDYATATWEQ